MSANDDLLNACKAGNVELARNSLSQGADPNFTDANGHTPIYIAMLFKHNHDSDEEEEKDVTIKLVKLLKEKGANTSFRDSYGNTLLLIAALNNKFFSAKWLIEENLASLNEKNNEGYNALALATNRGSLRLVQYLNAKLDENSQTQETYFTALELAIAIGNVHVVEYFVKKGIFNVNDILIEACKTGNVDLARAYLEQGADPNFTDANGHTPIYIAMLFKNSNDSDEDEETDATLQLVKLLTKKGADTSFKDNYGNTLLLIASLNNKFFAAKWLIEENLASLNEKNNEGYNALALAANRGSLKLVQYLVDEKNMSLTIKIKNKTPLEYAKMGEHVHVAKWITTHIEKTTNNNDYRQMPATNNYYRGNTTIINLLNIKVEGGYMNNSGNNNIVGNSGDNNSYNNQNFSNTGNIDARNNQSRSYWEIMNQNKYKFFTGAALTVGAGAAVYLWSKSTDVDVKPKTEVTGSKCVIS